MMGGGSICTPLVGLDFAACRLENRPVCRHPNPHGQWGILLGPNGSGAMAQNLKDPRLMPPAVRKASSRGILIFPQNPRQGGRPASMNTDAFLGSSVMGYQSWEIA